MPSSLYHRFRNSHLSKSISYSLKTLKQNPWGEISGSLGDLGTLLPIMTALISARKVDSNSTFIFTGIFNILSGMWYGVPIAVSTLGISQGEERNILKYLLICELLPRFNL